MAPAIARPRAADFPRPRAASKATVLLRDLSKIESRKLITALPCVYCFSVWVYDPKKHDKGKFGQGKRQIVPDPLCNTFRLKGQPGSLHGIDLLGLSTLVPFQTIPQNPKHMIIKYACLRWPNWHNQNLQEMHNFTSWTSYLILCNWLYKFHVGWYRQNVEFVIHHNTCFAWRYGQ